MNIEITKAEALMLARAQLQNNFYKHSIFVSFADEPADDYSKITSANKIELIKFARRLVEDTLSGAVTPAKDTNGKLYFGLAEAKRYVETYFNFSN
jgi:hypothetical protein